MPLSQKEQIKILQNTNSLELTPIKLYPEEIDEHRLVTILTPKFKNQFAIKFILPKMQNKYFKIKLDDFGSFIWLQFDGKNKVRDIVNLSVNVFGDKIHPAEDRINKFLLQLFNNKLITFNEVNR